MINTMETKRPPQIPSTIQLPNGHSVTVRATRRNDAALLQEMHRLLSPQSRLLRYHAHTAELSQEEAIFMCDLNPERQIALAALWQDDSGEHIVGHAQLARASSLAVEAETAIVIRDDFQKMGLGSHMLRLLLSRARSQGIKRVFGWVMSSNGSMLHLYRKTRMPIQVQHHSGEMLVTLLLSPEPD